jgi:hypothetical protein
MELIANAPNVETFAAAAQATGYVVEGAIQTSGDWQGRVGSWFFNYVGTQYVDEAARPGVWARLRINGDPDEDFTGFLAAVAEYGVTVYRQIPHDDGVCWSADGATCFADQSIGQIGLIM